MIIDNPNGDSYIQVFNVTSIGETTCNITGVMYSRLTRRYYACNTTTPKVPVVGNAISKTKEPESNPLYEVKVDDLMVALDTADIDGNVYLVLADIRSITKLTNGKLSVTAMIQAVSRITGSYNDLANIPVINQDLSATDFTPVANTYYRHTGATTDTFTQGVIYLYDTAYHKLGESGGGTTLNKYTYIGNNMSLVRKIMKESMLSYIQRDIENVPCALLVVLDTYNRASGSVARSEGIANISITDISGQLSVQENYLKKVNDQLTLTTNNYNLNYAKIVYYNGTEIT